MFCARLFICALWSPAGKGLTSWLSLVVSSVSLSLSHWYPGSGVVLDCIDSWSLHHYLLLFDEMTALSKVALYQHILKAAYQGSWVWAIARTGEMITKSSKLGWIRQDTWMYSTLWTTIPQASISSLDLVRYGCLQGAALKCSTLCACCGNFEH